MSFADIIDHEQQMAWERGEYPDTAILERRAADRILEGYRDLEEAAEDANLAQSVGNNILGCDFYGYWITPEMTLRVIEIKQKERDNANMLRNPGEAIRNIRITILPSNDTGCRT